jgi:RNA polymerase sigma-70 factor, ECF subfamily
MRSLSLNVLLLGPTSASPPSASLEALLEEIVRSAQSAWPGVNLAPDRFIPYLGRRLPTGLPAEEALRQIHTSDLYLACACAHGDAQAIAAFEARCLTVVDRAVVALPVDADVVAEVKQQLRRNLFVGDGRPPEILDFVGRGDLRGWVRVMAVRLALAMMRRARKNETADDDLIDKAVLPQESPELAYLKNSYRRQFKSAVGDAIKGLTVRERTLLRQHFIDGLTIDEIGTVYRVHRATAARWIARAREAVLNATRAALMKRLTIEPEELDSILRLINSRLEVSFRAFFRQRRP